MSPVRERPGVRPLLGVAGVVATGCGLAVAEGVAWGLRSDTSPVAAVAATVRDLTPGPVVEGSIQLLGSAGKPVLLTGVVLVVLVVGGYAATWARRAPWVPGAAFLGLAGLALAAVVASTSPPTPAAVALLAGLVSWVLVLRLLTVPLLGERPVLDDRPADVGWGGSGRRAFLLRAVVAGAVAAAAAGTGRLAGGARRGVEASRRLLRLPVSPGGVPDGAATDVAGAVPWRTPETDFYVVHTALATPSVRAEEWALRIHGMVEREVVVTYEDLLARGLTEAWVTLTCVSNPVGGDLVGNAYWSGVPVRELLAEAGPLPGADAVRQTSHDGWTCGTPLETMTDDRDALLAVAMNGEPLPVEHGFPARVVVPGLYGYVSATKWVVEWEVTTFDAFEAYWTRRGWGERGPVKTQSRIDVPAAGDSVASGQVEVAGVAWAQHTGIAGVEVQVDGGPWRRARLGQVPSADTWVHWTITVELDAGDHEVVCRATDATGATQTAAETDVLPDGATGWHRRRFSVD